MARSKCSPLERAGLRLAELHYTKTKPKSSDTSSVGPPTGAAVDKLERLDTSSKGSPTGAAVGFRLRRPPTIAAFSCRQASATSSSDRTGHVPWQHSLFLTRPVAGRGLLEGESAAHEQLSLAHQPDPSHLNAHHVCLRLEAKVRRSNGQGYVLLNFIPSRAK